MVAVIGCAEGLAMLGLIWWAIGKAGRSVVRRKHTGRHR